MNLRRICIDPGHGYIAGWLPTGVYANGLVEDDLVFDPQGASGLAQRMADTAVDAGRQVVLTRARSHVSLRARARTALGAMSDALVSLHCSVSRNPDRRGIRLYVVEGDLRSAALANRILKHLHRRFGSICRYRGVRWDTASDGRRLPLLRGLYRRMPAVHIDAGSLTNTVDAGLLNDRDFRQAWCKAVTDALTGM